MSDTEAPTPRESQPWQATADLAREISRRLRERELVLSRLDKHLDTRRAAMLRHARMIADFYAAALTRWLVEPVTDDVRDREQREFGAFLRLSAILLEGPST